MQSVHTAVPAGPATERTRRCLSILVPVYNEDRTISHLLTRLTGDTIPDSEVVVVNDGSSDRTAAELECWQNTPGVKIIHHVKNRGKGAAIRTALAAAEGEYVVIQDADLEYDPADIPKLLARLIAEEADIVYGSRYLSPTTRLPWSKFRVAVGCLNLLVRVLYGQRLTDEATCYKMTRTDYLRAMCLVSDRFELCAEITAKACRLGLRFVEHPISYTPRTHQMGKKIGWRDVWPTVSTLIRLRFSADAARAPASSRARRAGQAL